MRNYEKCKSQGDVWSFLRGGKLRAIQRQDKSKEML